MIRTVSFSPDGERVAWSGNKGIIRIRDLKKGHDVGRFLGPTKGIDRIAFSRDARLLASAGMDGTILIWDVSQLPD
jgi:WD40 repeat protein